jgi:hypothetical protein
MAMVNNYEIDQAHAARLLAASLRQLQHDADRLGAADVIHQLRNCVLTAQGALTIAERRLAQGRADDVERLLNLAEARIREGRALVARTRQVRPLVAPAAALAA